MSEYEEDSKSNDIYKNKNFTNNIKENCPKKDKSNSKHKFIDNSSSSSSPQKYPSKKKNLSRSRSSSSESHKKKIKKEKDKSDKIIVKEGEVSFRLDQKRRLVVRKFKGKLLVDIREYYMDDGKMKPGKKGIALSEENWVSIKLII